MRGILRSWVVVALVLAAAAVVGCSQDGQAVGADAASSQADAASSQADAASSQADTVAPVADTPESEADTPRPEEDAAQQEADAAVAESLGIDDWNGGSFVFVVNREWADEGPDGPAFPHDELDEEDYRPVDDGPRHAVEVSADGARVEVGENPMVGERKDAGATRIAYDLSEGLFAGGRFVVWETEEGLEAELTIYGSGRPIVQSERGRIVDAGADPM